MLAYRPPSFKALMRRRVFHLSLKQPTESITEWFERIVEAVNGCEFENLADIMLIDKFLSGVDEAVYQQIITEFCLDSDKALLLALSGASSHTNSTDNHGDFFFKVEIDEEHQEDDSTWFENDDSQWASEEDVKSMDFHPIVVNELPILEASEVQSTKTKPAANRKGTQANGNAKRKAARQKRNDFLIDDQNRFVCLQCLKSYATRKSFRRHYLIHTESSLPCPKCGKLYPTNPTLRRHMSIHEGDGKKDFECYICRNHFHEMIGLRVHLGKVHKRKKCSRKSELRKMKSKSKQQTKIEPLPIPHVCEFCGKSFDRKEHWKRHLFIHTNVRPHQCELCGQGFARKDRLTTHMLLHTGERPHVCRFCSKSFRLFSTMKQHEVIHSDARPHKCQEASCGKTFSRLAAFLRHKKIHAEIRPFGCQMCEKKFASNYHLQRHMTVHTGAKPYCCDLCGNRFTQMGSMTMHKTNVHGVPPNKSDPN